MNQLRGKKRSIAILVSLLVSLSMMACSSAPAAPTSAPAAKPAATTAAPATVQQGISNKVVTIGMGTVTSGPASAYGAAGTGLKDYLDMLNKNGGVNGYTFKYVERDTAFQPAQGVAVAQQLVNEDKVFAFSGIGTPVVSSIRAIAEQLKAPIFGIGDGELAIPTQHNYYAIGVRFNRLSLFDAQFAVKTLKITDLGYAYQDDATGKPGLTYLPAWAKANGATVTSVGFPVDITDMAPIANKLKSANVKAVNVYAPMTLVASLQKASDAIGFRPTWLLTYGTLNQDYLKLAGPLAEGSYFNGLFLPTDSDSPAMQKFLSVLKANGHESQIGSISEMGWTVGAIIERGVAKATAGGAALTWASFEAAVDTINGEPLGAMLSVTFKPDNHVGAVQATEYVVKGGKFVEVQKATDIPEPPK